MGVTQFGLVTIAARLLLPVAALNSALANTTHTFLPLLSAKFANTVGA